MACGLALFPLPARSPTLALSLPLSGEDSYVVARDCSAAAVAPLVGAYCLSVPATLSPLAAPLALAERGYLQVDALTGPAYDELLMPRAFSVALPAASLHF